MFKFDYFINKNLGDSHRYVAFTLAEVLITLGIIGIVAAMTIPTIINSLETSRYKTAYKKAYSDGTQVIKQLSDENLFAAASYNDDNNVYKTNFTLFMNRFKVINTCVSGSNTSECWDFSGENIYGVYPNTSSYAFIDASGVAWCLASNNYHIIFIDTNGFNPPNQFGKDRFAFKSTETDSTMNAVLNAWSGKFTRLRSYSDNDSFICATVGNKCTTEQNYYGASWLRG